MRKSLSLMLMLLFAVQISFAAKIQQKKDFLSEAEKIDKTAAERFVDNLTDADWFEADKEMLLESFQAALDGRNGFPWGDTYSDSLYYKYVLPPRVDDEPLQPYRKYFLDEIGPRLKDITTLTEAALEVNLWLGERIGFKPTDWRDQGPLTTLSCGFGRCGELMIVAIDAMRSVGIPARGVYVPFWSSSDNNHAWIEVYTEDGWKYMGACEPAARLNEAWFDKSVLRAAILLSKGSEDESEHQDIVKTRSGYTLNVTRNYVDPAILKVAFPEDWEDEDGVWLSLFNFGTIRPIVELVPTDGIETLEVGHGDFMLLGLYNNELFVQPFNAQLKRETHLVINPEKAAPLDFTLAYPWPPMEKDKGEEILERWRLDMAGPLRKERDAKREWNSEWLKRFIDEKGGIYNDLFEILEYAPGNAGTIMNAVLDLPEEKHEQAIFTLNQFSAKDLRDVNKETLRIWLDRDLVEIEDEELKASVLGPKVAYEYPAPEILAHYATDKMDYTSLDDLKKDVKKYSKYVDDEKFARPLPPLTIDHMLAAKLDIDERSAASWWVDRLRRAGIPAKKSPWSTWLEFYWEGEWKPLVPSDHKKLGVVEDNEDIQAHYKEKAKVAVSWKEKTSAPAYESEFCFVPLTEKNWPDYRREYPESLEADSVTTNIEIFPGTYFVTAGRRNSRGDVRVVTDIVTVEEGQELEYVIDLIPPNDPPDASGLKISVADLQMEIPDDDRGNLIVILGENEPSIRTKDQAEPFRSETMNVHFLIGLNVIDDLDIKTLGLTDLEIKDAPFVFFFDEEGRLVFSQSGYDLNLPGKLRNSLLN